MGIENTVAFPCFSFQSGETEKEKQIGRCECSIFYRVLCRVRGLVCSIRQS